MCKYELPASSYRLTDRQTNRHDRDYIPRRFATGITRCCNILILHAKNHNTQANGGNIRTTIYQQNFWVVHMALPGQP